MRRLLIALGFEPCPLCAAIKGHAPRMPVRGWPVVKRLKTLLGMTEPDRPYCARCGWWHAGGCG